MWAESKRTAGPVLLLGGALVLALGLTGCPRTVLQDSHSGKDHSYHHPKKFKIEDNHGRSHRDIVTYPGGDRVDWKEFELPKGKSGTLKVRLLWKPPRPGLDLAFDLYDQYYHRIARAHPSPGSGKHSKKVTVKDADAGKYYVMIYAPRRIDAGTYRVIVEFEPAEVKVAQAAAPSDIPPPPTLPAIPEAPPPTAGGGTTPPGGTGGTTPPGGTTPDTTTQPEAKPVAARVVKYVVGSGNNLTITVDRGKNAGVAPGWKGQVLNSSGQPVEGGQFTVVKVSSAEAVGKVGLSVDQIRHNKHVLLTPPQ